MPLLAGSILAVNDHQICANIKQAWQFFILCSFLTCTFPCKLIVNDGYVTLKFKIALFFFFFAYD